MNKAKYGIIAALTLMLAVCVYTLLFHSDSEAPLLRPSAEEPAVQGPTAAEAPLVSGGVSGGEATGWYIPETEPPREPDAPAHVPEGEVLVSHGDYPTQFALNTSYTIGAVALSKGLDGEDGRQFAYNRRHEVDEQGNLTSPDTYCFIEVTIENQEEETREFLLNSIVLYAVEKGVRKYPFEPRYFDKGINVRSREYFHVFLAGGERQTYRLGMILPDDYLDCYDWQLVICPQGSLELDSTRFLPFTLP
ncbi:MAG: hypothetical protein HFJ80_07955 [Clostridiales bacterium]|nr:hypothetical protein [Clostridiales bacterium]